eukprot:8694009-Pyramimonas_sp.AAC.1
MAWPRTANSDRPGDCRSLSDEMVLRAVRSSAALGRPHFRPSTPSGRASCSSRATRASRRSSTSSLASANGL